MTPAEFAAARHALGLSQPQLAALLETTAASVRNWEQGKTAAVPGPAAVALRLLAEKRGA